MTDLTPNDLSHLSDEEFMALCPQGEHAPGPETLSRAAQAVWEAAWADTPIRCGDTEGTRRAQIAAALRAAADQVVPEENVDDAEYHCLQAKWAAEGEQDARMRLLGIAAELEGAQ